MAQRKIAVEFDADLGTSRALARAIHAMLIATDATSSATIVDGFSMLKSDGWTGDYKITVEPRS